MPEAESSRLRPDRTFYNSHRSLLPLFPESCKSGVCHRLMGHQDALGFKDIPNLPDVALEFLILVRQPPLPRTRQVNLQVEVDPAWTRRHDEHEVYEENRILDVVGDEQNRVLNSQPDTLKVHDHLLASKRIQRSEWLIHQKQARIL